jgi:hypothetical protein
VVYTHFGEGEYDVTENNVRLLLGIKDKAEAPSAGPTFNRLQTPEIYLGHERAENFRSLTGFVKNAEGQYQYPRFLPLNSWALNGKWRVDAQKSVATEADASLQLNFNAKKVFLVLGSASGAPLDVSLTLNGEPMTSASGKDAPKGRISVKGHTLYELVDQGQFQNGLLEIKSSGAGLEVYAFTFEG